jgi:hypothetical protein
MACMITSPRLIATIAAAGALAAAGTAVAQQGGPSVDSQITVGSRTVVAAPGDTSPVDVGGVRAIRRGKPVPSGYRLIGRKVTFVRGTEAAYGYMTMRCPAGKTLRGLASQGGAGFAVQRTRNYVGRPSVDLFTFFNANRTPVGKTVSGTILAACR